MISHFTHVMGMMSDQLLLLEQLPLYNKDGAIATATHEHFSMMCSSVVHDQLATYMH